ncbi:BglG family transcription antiterminator [Enterococcus hulanensis]|uniref:BglG family transcription antiterminator n=1 Tax=Enterococcus hulanensis TaxID=2559929 RepID=A0ABU3EVH8_9ENTE|nr:BglG family transcription antiterminator [Enterococcus hulanensis]MDT2598871.1 BglG family transcription antiterminator [Enterococcus hulanensis]MDT2607625.1 BglG family transcription antiterminator [Enterococcus hulanensis]MDT2614920.1 BglG family transcription antiterminator [Enterococcus hulanensis]MDT2627110.1 BglG family transcription antiterminator [Enterococcus hulanensis]MDT2653990.1 BglG family transcription antiterminator [Enterococcus hulanensis]
MRQEKIVEYLYAKKQAIAPKALAAAFQISERTLANDIKWLKEIGAAAGFDVERVRSAGYQLKILDQAKFQSYLAQTKRQEQVDSTSPQERIKNIELLLLFHEEYITMQQIAEWLDVSLSTVKADIKQVEQFCENYELSLFSKAHYGLKIIGTESKKRRAILYLIRNTIHTPVLTERYKEFNFVFDEADLRRFLQEQLQKNQLKISDIVFENIVQHIRLLSFRIMQDNTLNNEEDEEQKIGDDYDRLTEELVAYVEATYHIVFSNAEKNYLEEQLRGKFAVLDDAASNRQLKQAIDKALEHVDRRYHTHFREDQDLANALLMHVAPLQQRLYTGHQLENPIIDDIYTQYANVFNVAMGFINELNKDLDADISKDEIGYVAIYFAASLEKQSNQVIDDYQKIAVICSTGGGAAYLLKVTLERLFSNAEVDTFALNEIDQIDSTYDLMISTVPLQQDQFDIPIIYTKTILNQAEITKIEKDLNLLRESQNKVFDVHQFILSLFDPDWFQIDPPAQQDYLALLEKEGVRLEEQGLVEQGFKQSVLEREKMIDTIYQHGIAGPHPMEQAAVKEVIDVILLKKPLSYREKQVRVIFLINIKKDHLNLHKEISRLMIKMMDDPTLDNQLQKITNFQDFMSYMKSLMKEG